MTDNRRAMTANVYSTEWYETFADRIPEEETRAEMEFLARWLPREEYPRILDLCCGKGRHANRLAALGYAVTGVDASSQAIGAARATAMAEGLNATYVEGDVRTVPVPLNSFDAVIIMWQSFGYFSDEENRGLLAKAAAALRAGGRLILDVYNRDFHVRNQGRRTRQVGDMEITATATVKGRRMEVVVEYAGLDARDIFEWCLYTPDEMARMAEAVGLDCVHRCAGFDAIVPPGPDRPGMQIILEKAA